MMWADWLLVYVGLLCMLLAIGISIGTAMGLTGLAGLALISGLRSWPTIGDIFWNSINSFTLVAVPLFIFMGEIVMRSGLSGRFYRGISHWLRGIPGGLVHSNIVGCAVFAAFSGSSVATALMIGTAALPELRSRGYDTPFILGSLAAGGLLGILIPPSIPLIIYASMAQESVIDLFAAGFIPGILIALGFLVYVYIRARLDPTLTPDDGVRSTWPEKLRGLVDCWPILGLIVCIMGGIYAGLVTPTEAAAFGSLFALAVSLWFRELDWPRFRGAVTATVVTTCVLFYIIVNAQILTFAIVEADISRGLSGYLSAMNLTQWQFYAVLCLVYIVLGMFVDGLSMLLLTIPILYPAVKAMGFDGVWFGIILVVLIEFGAITPPVGLNLFAIKSIAVGSRPGDVARGALPYTVVLSGALVLFYLFPGIVLWLPAALKG